ncbi:MAG: hypothetical protein AB8U25_06330 [Rickettsiales endosymbiont of Dermacentor nuttalli]
MNAFISGVSSDAIYSEGSLINNGSLLTKIIQNDTVYKFFLP